MLAENTMFATEAALLGIFQQCMYVAGESDVRDAMYLSTGQQEQFERTQRQQYMADRGDLR